MFSTGFLLINKLVNRPSHSLHNLILRAMLPLALSLFVFLANGQNLHFDKLDVSTSLSNSWIRCIHKDSRGYLWFGTWDGLNKYDGYDFTVFQPGENDNNSISGNIINTIYEHDNGDLWIGTIGHYISIYNRDTEQFYPLNYRDDKVDRSLESVNCFLRQNDSILLIGTEHGLDIYNIFTTKITRITHKPGVPGGLPDNILKDLVQTDNKDIWIATTKGLSKLSDNTSQFITYTHNPSVNGTLPDNGINALHVDGNGQLWVGTNKGLSKYLPDKDAFEYLPLKPKTKFVNKPSVIRDIADDRKGKLFVSTDDGLFILKDGEQNHYLPDFRKEGSLSSNNLTELLYDNFGTLWIGTYNGGVNYYNELKNIFTHISTGEGQLNNPNIYSITEDKSGNIWAGSGKGINIINRGSGKLNQSLMSHPMVKALENEPIISLLCDKRGNIWAGTYESGLFLLEFSSGKFFHYKHNNGRRTGPASNFIYRIHELRDGTVLIVNQKKIEFFNFSTRAFKDYLPDNLQESFDYGIVHSMYEDLNGVIWMATNYGIWRIDKKQNQVNTFLQQDTTPTRLKANKTTFITGDTRGNIWIGLGGDGLDHLDPNTKVFTHFGKKQGLPHNTITNIVEDTLGNIWLTSGYGIVKFVNGVSVPTLPEFKLYELTEKNKGYDFKEGSIYRNLAGDIYVGSNRGLYIFNPKDIKDNPYVPKLTLTNLIVFNSVVTISDSKQILQKQLNETRSIRLSYKESVFTISFAALNFIYPQHNYYAYRLDGVSDWIDLGIDRSVTFSNLAPGEYNLQLRAANNNKVWNPEIRELRILITPPWYKTTLFRIIFIISVTLLIVYLVHRRIAWLKRQHTILSDLVEKRTAEINRQKEKIEKQAQILERTNLELINKNQEVLSQKEHIENIAEQLHEADQLKLKFFTNISHELLTPLTLIIGSLESLLNTEKNPERLNVFNIMLRNGNKLLHLFKQLIDFRKIDKNALRLQVIETDIVAFVKEIMGVFEPLAERKKIIFTLKSHLPLIISWFDPDKVEKILYNLLSNAFKFTPDGGGIRVEIRIVNDSAENLCTTDFIEIRVIDNGQGIKEENLAKIFDRFYAMDASSDSPIKGTGIGLSYALELSHLHRGSLSVTSIYEKGSVFILRLPFGGNCFSNDEKLNTSMNVSLQFSKSMLTTDEEEISESNIQPHSPDAPVVLIVEDNKSIRSFIKTELTSNYFVFEAVDGYDGFVKAKEQMPDIIITDIMMPGMNGIELCKKLKTDILTSHIPVLVLTAKTGDENRVIGFENGADDYITKPFSLKVLLARIQNLIESRRLLREKFVAGNFLKDELTPTDGLSSIDRKFLERVSEIVLKDISNPEMDNKLLMKEIGMGKSQLYAKIKALTGQSVHEFMRVIKLNKAAELLKSNEHRISDVAYLTGFNSLVYFSQCFKNHFNVSPSEYARLNINKG